MAQTTIENYAEKQDNGGRGRLIRKDKQSSGPFRCCYELTKKESKKMSYKGLEYRYDVWHCSVCRKEYFDAEQAKKMERFWLVERMLDEKLISMKRKMNFDGKAFFFRFPKELTERWDKNSSAEIKVMSPETFLVEIRQNKE